MASDKELDKLRHSTAHLLAAAILKLYPGTKHTIGPVIENGFYYDFDFGEIKITESDLPKIESEMGKIIKTWDKFAKIEVTLDQVKKEFKGNAYKIELAEEFAKSGDKLTFYKSGDFIDLCRGGHIDSTKKIKYFKLTSVAGAYWRGSEKNKMLTRIYGTAFFSQNELDEYLKSQIQAKENDHRKLNERLKIYMTNDEIGQGLITLLPNGAVIAQELEKWAVETENKWGYVRVMTPHIASEKVFKISGHVPYYLESMYPKMDMEEKGEGEKGVYYLKPMNCAHHHLVFKNETRSYKDLPLRIAEYGTVYRYEKSGELLGMMRVRGPIHQNDAHIFCTEEQAEKEFKNVMDLHKYYYDTLGLNKNDYYLSFAVRDPKNKKKYIGGDDIWEKAEKIALKYIKSTKIPYQIEVGGAAFYGPKIDFNIRTSVGKTFAASTNQLDFFLPKAFGLTYVDHEGKEKIPVCIHRAPLGAHVRFIAFLMEHFGGNFPTWLTPVQVKVLPITDRNVKYANEVLKNLRNEGIRTELDIRNETLQAKIRDAQLEKVAYMLIVGEKEVKSKSIAVRARSGKDYGQIKPDKFIENIKREIAKKVIN